MLSSSGDRLQPCFNISEISMLSERIFPTLISAQSFLYILWTIYIYFFLALRYSMACHSFTLGTLSYAVSRSMKVICTSKFCGLHFSISCLMQWILSRRDLPLLNPPTSHSVLVFHLLFCILRYWKKVLSLLWQQLFPCSLHSHHLPPFLCMELMVLMYGIYGESKMYSIPPVYILQFLSY